MSDEIEYVFADIPGWRWPRKPNGRPVQVGPNSDPPRHPRRIRVIRDDKVVAEWPGPIRSQDHPMLYKTRGGRAAKLRRALVERDGQRCYLCGVVKENVRDLRIEHRTPRSRGGGNRRDNLALACVPCDIAKGDMTEEEYRATTDP
jgi:hypothetical protein